MKKGLLMLVAAAILAAPLAPALADDSENKIVVNGMVRGRYEYFTNYLDLTDNDESGDANDDSFALAPYRVVVGLTANFTDNVSAHVDLQYAGVFGDEFTPFKDGGPFNDPLPLGQGGTPYLFATQGMQLYQGYIDINKIGGSNIGVRVGRAEHTYGTELFLGDNDYYNGTSFDGARLMWTAGKSDLNAFYYKIAELNGAFFDGAADDSDLFGVTYDYKTDGTWGTFGGYVIAAQDLAGAGPIEIPDSKLYTIGAHWMRPMTSGDGTMAKFDWNLEAAMQTGDAGDPFAAPGVDLSGYVVEGWFGWNFGGDKSHGRLHAGIFMTSGDDPDTTDEIEDFNPLFGDYHANNRLGDLDFVESDAGPHNITNINVGYQHWFGDHSFMAAVHYNMLTEDTGFTDDKLGLEVDLGYAYQYSKNLAFEVNAGQFMPDTAMEEFFLVTDSDPVMRINGGVKLTW
ncbi:MAG TPA: alginate export family protein [Candidatus Polarisedimenticolaceae bacterium]|nr:alginate export family protein [Candidatus Polarisedimenticolaceae bacterium]